MKKIYIYGAGIQGKIFLDACQQKNMAIAGFIDDYCPQTTRYNKPIFRSNDFLDKNASILISVGLMSRKIKQQLILLNFTHVYDFTESVHYVPSIINELKQHSLWFSHNTNDMVNQQALKKVDDLLVDKKSKQLLAQIIRFRQHFNVNDYVTPDTQTQYFPDDIDVLATLDNIRFIDAGAYTGDTAKSLLAKIDSSQKKLDYIACFEPDNKNLVKLRDSLTRLKSKSQHSHFFVYPAGVWHKSEFLSFDQGNSASSCVTKNSQATPSIFGVSIDECVFNSAPNFIKMDIEGAEKQALQGALKTITTYKPILTICLYHTPTDLWEIPLWINEHCPFYKMHLRVYGDMLLETVLYCIPKQTI